MDTSSKNVSFNYNGSSPSGFTKSDYTGITNNCSLYLSFSNNPRLQIIYGAEQDYNNNTIND